MIKGQVTITPDSGGAGDDQQLNATVAAMNKPQVFSEKVTIAGSGVEKSVQVIQNKKMRAAILCGYENARHFNIYTFEDGAQIARMTFDTNFNLQSNVSFASQRAVPQPTGIERNFAICDGQNKKVGYFDQFGNYYPFVTLANASNFDIAQVLSEYKTSTEEPTFEMKAWSRNDNSYATLQLDESDQLAAYYKSGQSGYANANFVGNAYFALSLTEHNWYYGSADGKPLICTFGVEGLENNKNWAASIDRDGEIEAMCFVVGQYNRPSLIFISINGEIFVSKDKMETWESLGKPTFISESSQEEETMTSLQGMAWYNGRLYFIGQDSYDTSFAILGYCDESGDYKNWTTKTFPFEIDTVRGPIWFKEDNKIQFFAKDTQGDYLYHFYTYDFDVDYTTTNYPGPDWGDPETSYGDGGLCRIVELM